MNFRASFLLLSAAFLPFPCSFRALSCGSLPFPCGSLQSPWALLRRGRTHGWWRVGWSARSCGSASGSCRGAVGDGGPCAAGIASACVWRCAAVRVAGALRWGPAMCAWPEIERAPPGGAALFVVRGRIVGTDRTPGAAARAAAPVLCIAEDRARRSRPGRATWRGRWRRGRCD